MNRWFGSSRSKESPLYMPLTSPSAYRLVKLDPSSDTGRLTLKSSTHDLSDAPAYVALSYVCGEPYRAMKWKEGGPFIEDVTTSPCRTVDVTLNDHEFKIYGNLSNALAMLQKAEYEGYLWVDVLCIHQEDADEKAAQVMLMERIYATADEVFMYLGPPHRFEQQLQWALTTFLLAFRRAKDSHGYDVFRALGPGDPEIARLLQIEDPTRSLMNVMFFFEECRYFSRAWVIQEMIRGPRLRVFCGFAEYAFGAFSELAGILKLTRWASRLHIALLPTTLDRDVFGTVIRWSLLRDQAWTTSPAPEKRAPNVISHFPDEKSEDLQAWVNARPDTREKRTFAWLARILSVTRLPQCSDKRDKIYSILGIAKQLYRSVIEQHIQIDYRILWQTLFRRTAAAIMEKTSSIDALSHVEEREPEKYGDSLPSWVPDYSFFHGRTALASFPHFDASDSKKSDARSFHTTNNTFICTGIDIDSIVRVCPHRLELLISNENIRDMLEFMSLLPEEVSGIHRVEVFWKTMIANTIAQNSDGFRPTNELLAFNFHALVTWKCAIYLSNLETKDNIQADNVAELTKLLERLNGWTPFPFPWDIDEIISFRDIMLRFRSSKGKQDRDLAEIEKESELAHRSQVYTAEVGTVSHGRRLYMTNGGRLVLGPNHARTGDKVFLLRNSRVLHLLRSANERDQFWYLGDCYVHGCMNGELLQGPKSLEPRLDPVEMI